MHSVVERNGISDTWVLRLGRTPDMAKASSTLRLKHALEFA